jgi:hypothetical protein
MLGAMLTLVKRLRIEGRRRRQRDINADPGALGELRQHKARAAASGSEYTVLQLTSGGAKLLDIIPPLYEPTLLGVNSDHFSLRGFERLGQGADAFTVIQEWYCTTVCPVCEAGQHTLAIRG